MGVSTTSHFKQTIRVSLLPVGRIFHQEIQQPSSAETEREREIQGMSAQQPPVYEVFFTGKDDPRDGYVVIGEDTKPIFYRFETPTADVGNPRTTVSSFFVLFPFPPLPSAWGLLI